MEITEQENEEIHKLIEHKFLGIIILNIEEKKNINFIEKRYIYSVIKLLDNKEIERESFRNLLSKGNLDSYPNLRSLSWKFLLGYINNKPEEWENYLDNRRNFYNNEKKNILKKFLI